MSKKTAERQVTEALCALCEHEGVGKCCNDCDELHAAIITAFRPMIETMHETALLTGGIGSLKAARQVMKKSPPKDAAEAVAMLTKFQFSLEEEQEKWQ